MRPACSRSTCGGSTRRITRAIATSGCAPRGAGFLYVRRDRQEEIFPPVISHGYNRPRQGYSRFQDLFDWPGTSDPTAWFCVAAAIDFLENLLPGGLTALTERNHRYAVAAQALLVEELAARPLCPPEMLGSMAAVELGDDPDPPGRFVDQHRLNQELFERFGIERLSISSLPRRGSCCGYRHRPTTSRGSIGGWRRRYGNFGRGRSVALIPNITAVSKGHFRRPAGLCYHWSRLRQSLAPGDSRCFSVLFLLAKL